MSIKIETTPEQEIELPAVPERFRVQDAASANWVVRRIVAARAYAAHVKQWCDRELLRAQREEQFFLHRFGLELAGWARQQIEAEHGRRKSIALPAGTIGFRTEPMKLAVVDEARLMGWCREHLPAAIRVSECVVKSTVNEHVKATGEAPAGTEIVGGQERFFLK